MNNISALKSIEDIDVTGKNVLVRADLEWPSFAEASEGKPSPREQATKNIVKLLQDRGAEKIKVIGHKGNVGQVVELGVDVYFDLRSDPREEEDGVDFALELSQGFDIYINEAFATSHRKHASFVALPVVMRKAGKEVCVGPRLKKEVEFLDSVFQRDGKKVLVIGGAKSGDKAKYAKELSLKFDVVLKGGLLPGVNFREDGLDISDVAIEKYLAEIETADVIVVAGPMGKFEDDNACKGTKTVYEAVANRHGFKVAGGGDTEAALEKFGVGDKFDWVSVGGGAMLEYLANGTLPALEAILG